MEVGANRHLKKTTARNPHKYNCINHIFRPGHRKFLFLGQKNFEISGHFSGHQNGVFTLK